MLPKYSNKQAYLVCTKCNHKEKMRKKEGYVLTKKESHINRDILVVEEKRKKYMEEDTKYRKDLYGEYTEEYED